MSELKPTLGRYSTDASWGDMDQLESRTGCQKSCTERLEGDVFSGRGSEAPVKAVESRQSMACLQQEEVVDNVELYMPECSSDCPAPVEWQMVIFVSKNLRKSLSCH